MSKSMIRKIIVAFVAFALAGAGIAGAVRLAVRGSPSIAAEYPDCPFPRVDAEYPRIIAVDEAPREKDKDAYDAYQQARRGLAVYLREGGGMAKATPDEREAFRLAVQGDDYAGGRERAVKVLRENPLSIPGRFVLAVVEHESEGNFPRALFLVRKLRRELHRRGVTDPRDAEARDWYIRVLGREWNILDDLARDEETLRVLDLIEQVYAPIPANRIWPLTRLKRFDEARTRLEEAERLGRMRKRTMNSRLVLESALGNRKAAYDAAKAAVDADPDSAVLWSNFATQCLEDFRPQEAAQARLNATRVESVDFQGSPFTYLATDLAARGRPMEAWVSLLRAQAQRRERAPYTLIMDQKQFDNAVAGVLSSLGRSADAYRLARRAFDRPARSRGSEDQRDRDLSSRLFLLGALEDRQQELREIEAAGGARRASAAAELRSLALERWTLERQILKLVSDEAYLVKLLRPSMPGVPSGGSALARLLPRGVAYEALRKARKAEDHPGAAPYFDAVEARLAWEDGRLDRALTLAKQARDQLSPHFDRDLRTSLAVIASESLRRLGRIDEAFPLFNEALANGPVWFRTLGVAVPVLVAHDGSPLARAWADRVLASLRFRSDPKGFPLALRAEGGTPTFELSRLPQGRHCRGTVNPAVEPSETDLAAVGVSRLIAKMMSPALELSTAQVNALDNSLFSGPSRDTERLLRLTGAR